MKGSRISPSTKAADALVRWRREWERMHCQGPCENNGQTPAEIAMWKLAGKIMAERGIKRVLP